MRFPLLVCLLFCGLVSAEAKAKHVVLIVWDGMRPDFVTNENTPNLVRFEKEGTSFRFHHSAYPSLTNVNGTVLATGVYPERSGTIGNNEYRPEIDARAPIDTAVSENIRKGDEASGGKYLAVPTITEMIQAAGKTTAIAGTKWVANLFDRPRARTSEASQKSERVTAGLITPEREHFLGKFPEKAFPNIAQDEWTTRLLTQSFWKNEVPAFSLLWLSDPDFTQHESAPGSPTALAAIKHCDAMLGVVLDALDKKQARPETDIFIVSDHGFSTVDRSVDLPSVLTKAGFDAVTKFDGTPKPGRILVVGNGGTAFFYVTPGSGDLAGRLVEFLQQSDFAGVIFSRTKLDGTFALADAHLDKKGGPDVVMSFRWNEKPNQFAAPGMITADAGRAAGKGTHATLSRFDLHNILFAAGPDFRRDFIDDLPTGNIDLVPTILSILGLTPAVPLDGRILSEAMINSDAGARAAQESQESRTHELPAGRWQQLLRFSTVEGKTYIDQGNGSFEPTTR